MSTPGIHTGLVSRTTGYLAMTLPAAGDLPEQEERLTFDVTPNSDGSLTLLHVLANGAKLAWGTVAQDRKTWTMWSGCLGVSVIKLSGKMEWSAEQKGFVLTETGYAVRDWAAFPGEVVAA